ncbi:MAG: aldo/keto reductase [Burkholderiales bacterium]|jgi:2,5-diketo-D-gluconate reductase A|nr:aldo/keto reductase [Burkholderiales bacterium]
MNIPQIKLNDGNTIPQLGLGMWRVDDDDAANVILKALEIGYRSIDTAAIYKNEKGIGRALARASLPRSELFITTKLWNSEHGNAALALRESLDRLGLAYVDLYLIHWPAPQQNRYVETWRQMIELQRSGLTRSIGVSNFTEAHLKRLFEETNVAPVLNQIELHPTFQQKAIRKFHVTHEIVTESWRPLGQGKDLKLPVVQELAARYSKTPAQIVLRWHVQNDLIVIPKSVTLERIRENSAIFDFVLTDDEMKKLAALDANERMGPDPDVFSML